MGEDVYKFAFHQIQEVLKKTNNELTLLVLLMANAPTINSNLIDKGIKILKKKKKLTQQLQLLFIICGAHYVQEDLVRI